MPPMLISYSSCYFSSLEGDIRKVSQLLTSWNQFELVFIIYHPVGQFRPVCFQVDIEIYEDKLGQSGDSIIFSHITIRFVTTWLQPVPQEDKPSFGPHREKTCLRGFANNKDADAPLLFTEWKVSYLNLLRAKYHYSSYSL